MARIFLDEMGGINQGGILASYGLPMSPFSTEEYAPTIVETPSKPTRTRRKQSKSKPKRNDGIIRNHDSVWDYKIQNGKLLTRRKTSDGNWIDITNNDEARQKIEQFTGRSIGNKQSASNNSQSSKPASTSKPSNSSQAQPSKSTSTTSTQQTARPDTSQPPRQQTVQQRPVDRQDRTRRNTTVTTQPRSLTSTRGANTEPDWQNMTEAEVDAYFGNSPLNGVTKVGRGNSNKKNELLNAEDLAANGWQWSDVAPGKNNDVTSALFESAERKVQAGDKILLDANGRVVPTSEVHRYINRGRIPLYISDYDAQFYQPQAYSKPHEIRMAELRRWENNYDRQQNAALATMFSLPALGISATTAPVATGLTLAGSELVGSKFDKLYNEAYGKNWGEALGGQDATGQFYAGMLQPGRIVGGMLGGTLAAATAPARNIAAEAIASKLPKPNVKGARLSLAMNKALNNKKLNAQDKRILKESVPYLFEPIRKTPMSITHPLNYGNYNYMNPALAETMTAGPYVIPNYTNGVPFGVTIPRNIWGEMTWLPGDPLNRGSRVPYLTIQ